MNAAFRPDEDVRKVAEAYSLDAVDFARDRRRGLLDWTDESVERIETLLAEYRSVVPVLKPSDEEIFRFAKAAGSYLGETFRRNHAGTWGMVTISGESVPGMMAKKTGELFWPWGRAYKRVTEGDAENVWHYYQSLVAASDRASAEGVAGEAPAWWRRILGA